METFHLRSHAGKQVWRVNLREHNEFFDYFVEQWLENEEIPVVLWSCYHRRRRTNNAEGGWNNNVNITLKGLKVLACLQKELNIATTYT
jgi:hypothetical protein